MTNKRVALAAVGLLLVVLAVRVWLARNAAKIQEIKDAIANAGRNPGLMAPVKTLARQVPLDEARAFLDTMAERFDCFWFDGASRFVQIHRMGYRYDTGTPMRDSYEMASDALLLTLVLNSGDIPAYWHGPAGCRIERIEFLDDSLRVSARLGVTDASDGSPEILVVPWPANTQPRTGIFGKQREDPAAAP